MLVYSFLGLVSCKAKVAVVVSLDLFFKDERCYNVGI